MWTVERSKSILRCRNAEAVITVTPIWEVEPESAPDATEQRGEVIVVFSDPLRPLPPSLSLPPFSTAHTPLTHRIPSFKRCPIGQVKTIVTV